MAFADYFDRGAVAAVQVVAGFDEEAFKKALSTTTVGIALGPEAAEKTEGRFLADMVVRLLARLYPSLAIIAAPEAETLAAELTDLARSINPAIEIDAKQPARVGVVVGTAGARIEVPVFAGSDGWLAFIDSKVARPVGSSTNPFGAGAAACLACANVFRLLFLGEVDHVDEDVVYSTYAGDVVADQEAENPDLDGQLPPDTVLIGCGAIGNSVAWALARTQFAGELHLVDPETIELSNLQRYVLAARDAVDGVKVEMIASTFANGIKPVPHQIVWAEFVQDAGYNWRHALVALDSVADRRAVQGSLPEWIVNAWTQPGDLGVSVHGQFSGAGSCLSCLYLPTEATKNEDELIAEALGVPDHLQPIRHLLHSGATVPAELLDAVAERLNVPRESLAPFEHRPVRTLYVEGLCGGAIVPLDRLGSPRQEVHVPLAHQSALAGVQLAASFARQLREPNGESTEITRINLLRPLGTNLRQPAKKSDPRCLCADADWVSRYVDKWAPS